MEKNRDTNLNKLELFSKKNIWDVIIIGGGITGAGIALGCSKNNLKTLLIDANDFGYSTSGNSSKLVHGGLRYLQNGQFHITYQSVREREKLLKELPYLVWPIKFVLPYFSAYSKLLYKFGLTIYDLFAMQKYHKIVSKEEIINWFPYIRKEIVKKNKMYNLKGGYLYFDAQTDDVRLVIRTLKDAESNGAVILNYFEAKDLLIQNNMVEGIVGYDKIYNKEYILYSRIVINATGFTADFFREKLGLKKIIRPLRGSHIVFDYKKLPIECAIGFKHPIDKRNIFVLPWLGKTVVGTTDVDHKDFKKNKNIISISEITEEEIQYLLEGVQYQFPYATLKREDIYSTWSGIRPVVSNDINKDPSKESRDIYVELHNNLLTITGGKLTTFRIEAKKVLNILKKYFKISTLEIHYNLIKNHNLHNLEKIKDSLRILSFYGENGLEILKKIEMNPKIISEFIYYTHNCIYEEEIKYSIKNEWVVFWEDLFYHRFRFGLVKKEKQSDIYNLYKNNL